MKPVASPWMPSTPATPATSACRSAARRSARCCSANRMRYYPDAPKWLNRDRFVLSRRPRFDVPLRLAAPLRLRRFPRRGEEFPRAALDHAGPPGVPSKPPASKPPPARSARAWAMPSATRFPARCAAARYNTAEHTIFDHHVFCLAGDGCLQEGVAKEAIAFAGHNGLDNLILIYDSNDVTLDAMAELTQSEDAERYFTSLGWDAVTIDGHDLDRDQRRDRKRQDQQTTASPKVIIAKTLIGKGHPRSRRHREGPRRRRREVRRRRARRRSACPRTSISTLATETRRVFRRLKQSARRSTVRRLAEDLRRLGRGQSGAQAAELDRRRRACPVPLDLLEDHPGVPRGRQGRHPQQPAATIINAVAKAIPQLITGSADLFGSTKNYIKDGGDFSARQSASAATSGSASASTPWARSATASPTTASSARSGATFLVFADYCAAPHPSRRAVAACR